MRRIHKFLVLPAAEKSIFFRAFLLLSYSRCSLQFKSFKDVVIDLSIRADEQNSTNVSCISSGRVASLLEGAAGVVPFSTCLSKSLAGLILFRSQGYQVLLHIGVKKVNSSMLEAHAWLTFDERVVVGNRSDLDDYQEMPFIFDIDKKV